MDGAPNNRKRQIIAALAVLILIVAIVAGASLADKDDGADSTSSTPSSTSSENTGTESGPASNATYKDGTYTAEGGYNSPGGAQVITVTVTLKDGVITDTSAKGSATDGEAQVHQSDFIAAYEDVVVGKKVGDLRLNRLAGASLTTGGFNNAIEQIRTEAET